jgi:hypothetical protein
MVPKSTCRAAAVFLIAASSDALSLPTRVLYDSSNHLHHDMKYHPEQAARIDACVKKLSLYMETALQPLELIDVAPTQSEILSSQKENHIKKPSMAGSLSHA